MSDTAGTPPEGQGAAGRPLGPGAGASPTGRGAVRRRRRRWVWGVGLGVSLTLVGAAAAGWAVYMKLEGNITPDDATAAELARFEKDRPTALVKDALNVLLIGSDSRAGAENGRYGHDPGTERSDTVILLHLSAGRRSATAVSIPRDLMVDVPDCRRRDGSRSAPMFTQFNAAFEVGGPACTIRTVEKLTDVRVDHHVVVDFEGFKDMVDAVDGVEVCLNEPIDDKDAHLRLPAGRVTLDGEQALGYVRARKTLGDGSDTGRIERQQRFLGALVSKVRSNEILLNPVKLYPVLDAATSSLTTDPELASLRGLYELVRGLRDIPTEGVQFLTVPRESYAGDVNRDQLAQPAAGKLFERLRKDEPVRVDTDGERKATEKETTAPADSASPAPTFSGNTAAEDTCA
ncbi:LCP family protein [Streptomyces cellulosae]|jgi:LCP family protein required for cell wall assembly|uniref:LCP family protein n=2 Tax=Streptomyces TaxID=1883 RepID=A0ABU3JH45_9ACTN|nr:LCP family protein [Streptomyces sp. McG7]MBT2907374.1 LCP family protein [Streptomyces sp. McG8]MDQ0491569.1 LCP family protein required for cell wall assembly [Streptomyces thermodiastaticus]MDT6974384.1 LCP family protein [Streptomyces thermocarboxydus]MYQ33737.1 LytR family transcriptional regulator [Streptomyces sp. SID4956]MYW56525.1 LytR family transcriptional regulator [Streptomyces sp. SID8376]THC51661.1 LytR family transcriptional regulator [Streptomyces sp. Akac8]WSB41798.1 LCP